MRKLLLCVALTLVAASACSDGGSASAGNITPGTPELFRSTIGSFEGGPAVVNFWATWCEPCKVEMPHIVEAAEHYAGRVSFLGVDVQDDLQAAAAFADEYGMTFESLFDPDRDIVRSQKLLGLPATQFYDASGELAFVKQGEISRDELFEKIEELL